MIKEITCSDAIVESLIKHGVDTVFGIPGAQTYALFDALSRYKSDIKLVVTRHEQGAGYMAFGYAKSTGKIGVYCVVPGPGLLNSTAALCTAHSAPVLCIAGQVPSAFLGVGHGMLHELADQLGILRTLTKWADRIDHVAETPTYMAIAFKHLTSGRIRPVALEVPMDILAEKAPVDVDFPDLPSATYAAKPQAIEAAAALLRLAKNPMIFVGSGAIEAREEVAALAKLLQAPVVSFRGGRGIVSDESPYGFSCASGYKLYPDVDVTIGIGSRLELPAFRWQSGVATSKLIRIDIDPTQIVRLRAEVPIVADSKLATRALLTALEVDPPTPESKVEMFKQVKEQSWQEIQKVQPQMAYLTIMREVLPRDGFIVEEISQVGFTSWFGFPVYEPRQLVSGGYQGNLGHGFQTALGVKVANPDKVVFSIAGDGGVMFGIQELATAVQFQIGVILLIFNNNAYGNVRRDQINFFDGNVVGSELRNPDFVKLAESFGAKAYRADSYEQFKTQLLSAIDDSAHGPVVIEVPCKTGSEVPAWEFLMPSGYGS
ncbi:MAG: acetolactate synthase-1/2/3 large subunit [Alcanivorax sp.]|jgi:acetolactate synthase-1/2/3 large subunit